MSCSFAVNESPKTVPQGKFLLGLGIGSYVGPGIVPLTDLKIRYGLTDNMDIGFRIFSLGIGADLKLSFADRVALSLGGLYSGAFGIQIWSLHTTLSVTPFAPGSGLYIFAKPIFSGAVGTIGIGTVGDITFAGYGFTMQGGLGFYANPESTFQPSVEVGAFLGAPTTFYLSIGLNFFFRD